MALYLPCASNVTLDAGPVVVSNRASSSNKGRWSPRSSQQVLANLFSFYHNASTRPVRKVSSHFEYLENRSRGLHVTWQPVRGDLTVQQPQSRGASQSTVRRRLLSLCPVWYEACPESIQPFWIFREPVTWPWSDLAASQGRRYCASANSLFPVGLVSRQWDAVDWACELCVTSVTPKCSNSSVTSRCY